MRKPKAFAKKSKSLRLGGSAVGVMALALFSVPTMAQEADDAGQLTEILVTARKVAENQQDVPVAISAFSGEELTERSLQRVQDIGRITPGLSTRFHSASPSAVLFALRGQLQNDALATLDPSVGVYVDGVNWARAYGLNGEFLDVAQVEVLKGPQGTLFGRNTTGGAISIVTNNPDLDEVTGRLSVTYGRFNEFQASGVLNLPIVNDRVGLRVAVQRLSRDGYVTNVVPASVGTAIAANNSSISRRPPTGSLNGLKLENRERWNVRGKLDIKPTENLTLRFSGEYFEMDELSAARSVSLATTPFTATNPTYSLAGSAALFVGATNGGPPPTTPANAGASIGIGLGLLNSQIAFLDANRNSASVNEVPYAFAKTQTYGLTGILDTGWGEIQLITGYRKVESSAIVDLDGSQYAIHVTDGKQELEQWSGELQFTGKAFGDALNFAMGTFAFHEKGFDQSISIALPALNPLTSHFYGLIDNDSLGVYVQGTMHLSDRLSMTAGLRYSVDDKGLETRNNNYHRGTGATICVIAPVAPVLLGTDVVGPTQCAVRRRDSFGGWSYTIGLEYKPTDDIMLYAKTSRGFRSGGQNLRALTPAAFVPFRPEVAQSYEIGLKSEFLDRRVRLNLAAYHVDSTDIQRSTIVSVGGIPATILGNAGKARFRGVEGELTVAPVAGLRVSATGSLTDPKYKEFSDFGGDRTQERFTGVAEESFTLAADYSTAIGSSDLKLRVDYSWQGDTPTWHYNWPVNGAVVPPGSTAVANAVNTQNNAVIAATTAPAAGFLGARASIAFADGQYELAVFGRNITNNRPKVSSIIVEPIGYANASWAEPATYGATATVKF